MVSKILKDKRPSNPYSFEHLKKHIIFVFLFMSLDCLMLVKHVNI